MFLVQTGRVWLRAAQQRSNPPGALLLFPLSFTEPTPLLPIFTRLSGSFKLLCSERSDTLETSSHCSFPRRDGEKLFCYLHFTNWHEAAPTVMIAQESSPGQGCPSSPPLQLCVPGEELDPAEKYPLGALISCTQRELHPLGCFVFKKVQTSSKISLSQFTAMKLI